MAGIGLTALPVMTICRTLSGLTSVGQKSLLRSPGAMGVVNRTGKFRLLHLKGHR
jgi:hypothetical protein